MRALSNFTALGLLVLGLSTWATVSLLAQTQPEPDMVVRVKPVPLNPDDPNQLTVGALRWVSGVELQAKHRDFGGFSGLVLSDKGRRMIAVSDKGHWFTATIDYDDTRQIAGLSDVAFGPFLSPKGLPHKGKSWQDAEAITRLSNGDFLVAFERHHRLQRYDHAQGRPHGPAYLWPIPHDLDQAEANKGLESLVALEDGRLVAITERHRRGQGTAAWVWQDEHWHPMTYATDEGYDPTAATLLPDGDLLVLERRYSVLAGPAARLKHLPSESLKPGAQLEGRVLAEIRYPLTIDNMEGLATWQNGTGETMVLMMSDDNFNLWQRNLLLLFVLER